jgi:hypothetical protein
MVVEVRILVTRENVERVVQLIRELLPEESKDVPRKELSPFYNPHMSIAEKGLRGETFPATESLKRYLLPPPDLGDLPQGKVKAGSLEAKYVGLPGLFNSFFPVKAVLRILAHMVKENNGKPVPLQQLVEKAVEVFNAAGLSEYRGFPKRRKGREKESAIARLVWHFIVPACEMGLIEADNEIRTKAWDAVNVLPTREGWEFAKLPNLILDGQHRLQVLSETERRWMLDFLRTIDREYKEYSFLKRIFEELKRGNRDIAGWLERDELFREYVKSWSRKKENPEEFRKQLRHVSVMFAQGKVALLRELGLISNQRNDYKVIRNLEEGG